MIAADRQKVVAKAIVAMARVMVKVVHLALPLLVLHRLAVILVMLRKIQELYVSNAERECGHWSSEWSTLLQE